MARADTTIQATRVEARRGGEGIDGSKPAARRRPAGRWTARDRRLIGLLMAIPLLLETVLVWLPALASVCLSFTSWSGVGLGSIKWIGLKNYHDLFTIYPLFRPALEHNVLWLVVFSLVAAPAGLLLAVVLDGKIAGSRIYQSAIYLPFVLSLAIVGFIWELIYSSPDGLLNGVLGESGKIDWLGNPKLNIWAVLVAACWRQIGYVMILYLAGLKSVDPALKEAATLDGANAVQTFRRVIFPVMRPINTIVLVVTFIESLRAFDLVYVINGGTNGLELLSTLVTQNIIGEASRIGYGSAIASIMLVLSTAFIVVYLRQAFRKEDR
jgi:ABC-type sugar transport system permease subunit